MKSFKFDLRIASYGVRTCLVLVSLICLRHETSAQPAGRQPQGDTLATVDGWALTSREVSERIELMPFEPKTEDRDFESVKRKAVESLIGEYLLSTVITDEPDSLRWRTMQTVLQKLFSRDAMYKREIRSRVVVSEEEILQGMLRIVVKRKVLAIVPPSMDAAKQFVRQWKRKRLSSDSTRNDLGSIPYRCDTVLVPFGSVDSILESAVFSLKKPLDISPPIRSPLYGLTVAVFLNDEPDREAVAKSLSERRADVQRIVQQRKEGVQAQEFVDKVLRGQRMEADSAVFRAVTRMLWEFIKSDTIAHEVPGGFRYLPTDVYSLMNSFHADLSAPMVRGSFGAFPLGEFLECLFHYDFTFPSLHPKSFSVSFFKIVRAMTEAILVAEEALRRGYQYESSVSRDVSLWTSYWKSRYVEFAVTDTVSMQEWEPYWSLWRYNTDLFEKSCLLNVQEILRTDSASAASLARSVAHGADMDSLARIFSERKEWRAEGGRSGWFRFLDRKELAEKTMKMPVGEIKGPSKLREGYSVLKLLGRRFDLPADALDSLLKRETKRVRTAHQQASINHYVAQLAAGRSITIYYERIKTVDILDVNMVTRRTIGFGGKINAAPVLTSQWQWVEEWEKIRNVLQ